MCLKRWRIGRKLTMERQWRERIIWRWLMHPRMTRNWVIQDNTRSGTKNSTKLILKRMKRNRMTIYLRQTRKMVMQEKRMTRQSTATITDIKCRWGSRTEVDSNWKINICKIYQGKLLCSTKTNTSVDELKKIPGKNCLQHIVATFWEVSATTATKEDESDNLQPWALDWPRVGSNMAIWNIRPH